MNNIKISMITIAYNSEKTIRETFESVRRQKYDNLEYIIIDGGSVDSTLAIAEEYRDVITKIVSEPDNGISDAMNKGIRAATGDLIGIIHSDDMLEEGALHKLAAAWDGKTDVYYGNCIIMDEEGNRKHTLCAKEDLSGLAYEFVLVHPAVFVTKACYEKWGLFDITLKCAMDYDMFLRFYKAGAVFKYIDEALAVYREGGTNMKYRRKTIDEVRDVSVRHGADIKKANRIRRGKFIKDKLRPIQKLLKLSSKRVRKK